MENELKPFIDEHMPYIDEILASQNIPIHKRFILAGKLFVEVVIEESTFATNDELLNSEVFRITMLPLFNDWYWEKYGELANGPKSEKYSGIVTPYGQPILILIPATISRVEVEGVTSRLTFPDHLHESESLKEMLQAKFDFDKMTEKELMDFKEKGAEIVGLTRSINLDLNMATGLEAEMDNMAKGIWSHFEKAINDILTMKNARASIACWDIHLAIEKALKVLISTKSREKKYGHDLGALAGYAEEFEPDIEYSLITNLPTSEDAIKLRYAELIRTPTDSINYYIIGLKLVSQIASKLEHKLGIKNASITLKPAPWAR